MSDSSGLCGPSGAPLSREGEHVLREPDGRRWPVLDGIPYLRTGRDDLVRAALARIDARDPDGALVVLLADQDDWWDGPRPSDDALRALVRDRSLLSLREAMAQLSFGRVGDYFAHRWSDPTFLAGLALLEAHWRPTRTAFELACGIGQYLRELDRRGVEATGVDVVFSKLWLARHWVVAPTTRLLCCDARDTWPVSGMRYDLVICQDAFYFLEPKPAILAALRALVAPAGRLSVGHIHNREASNYSAGSAVTAADLAGLFPDAVAYDDAELTRALAEGGVPQSRPLSDLRDVEAFALVEGGSPARPLTGGLSIPPAGATLRRNPLYAGEPPSIVWPSERYRGEYAPLATYAPTTSAPERATAGDAPHAAVRRRELVDLPERW